MAAKRGIQMANKKHIMRVFTAVLAILVFLVATSCRTAPSSEVAEIHAQKSSTLIAWLNDGASAILLRAVG